MVIFRKQVTKTAYHKNTIQIKPKGRQDKQTLFRHHLYVMKPEKKQRFKIVLERKATY